MSVNSPLFDQLIADRSTPSRPAASRRSVDLRHRALTPIERQIADEKGGSVAQLIHGLLDDETLATRRWPFHPTR